MKLNKSVEGRSQECRGGSVEGQILLFAIIR